MASSKAGPDPAAGFDFLHKLAGNAGAALPSLGQWIAPTLDPDEIDKRIQELRTVQFWLEQNARILAATIQGLEVQRMTLATLKTMNVQMEDLRESLLIRMPGAAAGAAAREAAPADAASAPAEGPSASAGAIDPMQWWGALTRQFTELATGALKDAAPGDAAEPARKAPAPDAPRKRAGSRSKRTPPER